MAEFVAFNQALYFVANDGSTGYEVWRSDGTPTGTLLLKDISISNGARVQNLSAASSKAYFYAEGDGNSGNEVWVSNGTSSGTFLPRDISPTFETYRSPIITVNEQAFFRANDGVNGTEVWASDGSPNGTRLVSAQ